MSSLLPFALPLQRRLTKLYTDTKASLASVASTSTDADLGALHRQLRIQKDRLVTWGLRWSAAQHADIDEALAAAGLADLVASVMGTIKDILAEAEPLWAASRTPAAADADAKGKAPQVLWDRRRFEELVRDLASSIDTLYDISRVRQGADRESAGKGDGERIEVRAAAEERAFDKSRMETPQAIAPSRLHFSNGASICGDDEALGDAHVALRGSREILYLARAASTGASPWTSGNEPARAPVLVEFAAYDPVYAVTGIAPEQARFERLCAALQRGAGAWWMRQSEFGTLDLLGYFEDAENARVGLVYALPQRFPAVRLPSPAATHPYYARLADLTAHRALEPPLEVKFRLAYNLASSVAALHAKGVVHGNLAPCNVAFFEQYAGAGHGLDWLAAVDVRRPFLTAFDLFSEPATHGIESAEPADVKWYRHALDPRLAPGSPLTPEARSLDLYALALVLVEIGLWRSSQELGYGGAELDVKADVAAVDRELAARCGSAYVRAVRACWGAVEEEVEGGTRADVVVQRVYGRVLGGLERCCGIEEGGEGEVSKGLGVAKRGASVGEAECGPADAAAGTAKVEERDAARFPVAQYYVLDPGMEEARHRIIQSLGTYEPRHGEEKKREEAQIDHDIQVSFRQPEPPMQRSRGEEKKREEAQIDHDIQTQFRNPSPALETGQIAFASQPTTPKMSPQFFPTVTQGHATVMRAINYPDARDSPHKLKQLNQAMLALQPSGGEEKKREEAQINFDIMTLFRKPSPAFEKSQIAPASSPAKPKAKPRRFPAVALTQAHLDHWHATLMPAINHSLRGFYRKHAESVEISLESVGETAQRTRPTILVVCTSVAKVKAVLKRYFAYDAATYGLVVCKGKAVRSRKRRPRRSMAYGGGNGGDDEYVVPKNPHHQARPRGGASIAAFAEGQALMPVSFGGVVLVDDEPFGLTVHHMLDVPSDSDDDDDDYSLPTIRSDALPGPVPLTSAALDALGESLSDSDSSAPSSAASSIVSSSASSSVASVADPGDVAGIEPDCAAGYLVTQPAFDDVDPMLFPDAPLAAYLAAYTLGALHASSGLRRTTCAMGWRHEIDWALFRFAAPRHPPPGAGGGGGGGEGRGLTRAIPTGELGGLAVRATARTSGSTRGRVLPGLSSVKMRGRRTASESWVVEGGVGVPGDSGAWIVGEGGAAGHVLAWSERRRVGYFCPMEVMLEDIREALGARRVGFPALEGGVEGLEEGMGGLGIVEVEKVGPRRGVFGRPRGEELVGGGKARGEMEELVAGMEGVCVSSGLVLRGPSGLSGL